VKNNMMSKGAFTDKLELYRIDGNIDSSRPVTELDLIDNGYKDLETKYNLSPFEKVLKALGLYRCIDDALTNYAVTDLATYILTKYGYASQGTDGTDGTNYTLTDLKSPVMTRVALTKSFDTTYTTNDTAVFTGIGTATGDYTLCEFGLHDALTDGNMGARQVSCSWDVVNAETYGYIWRIVASRG